MLLPGIIISDISEQRAAPVSTGAARFIRWKMRIFLTRKSYFTFRGIKSPDLDLLGVTVFELMRGRLQAETGEGEGVGERVVIDPVYPFLTRERLLRYLDEREGSYAFAGGYVVRRGSPAGSRPKTSLPGQPLFSLADYPSALREAAKESAKTHLARGALVEEGAEVSFTARLSRGAVVGRGCRVLGRSVVGEGAELVDSVLLDARVGAGTAVIKSWLRSTEIGENCTIGPFACLCGSVIADGQRVRPSPL